MYVFSRRLCPQIDAGSTGSRMHVYEFEPRILATKFDVAAAVSGKKLSFPGTESRWTERLRPGISDFADIEDDAELEEVRDFVHIMCTTLVAGSGAETLCRSLSMYFHSAEHRRVPRAPHILREVRTAHEGV